MDSCISKLIDENEQKEHAIYLEKFVQLGINEFKFPELSENSKRKRFWHSILTLATSSTDKKVLINCFIAIRILRYYVKFNSADFKLVVEQFMAFPGALLTFHLGREKVELKELITDEWYVLIKTHSGLADESYQYEDGNLTLALEAEKCLWNIIFNCSTAPAICCKNGILELVTLRLQKDTPYDIKIFDAKVLFLLTALCREVRHKEYDNKPAIEVLMKILESVLKEEIKEATLAPLINEQNLNLVCEVLKALYNLTLNCFEVLEESTEDEKCKSLVLTLKAYFLIPISDHKHRYTLHSNIINLITNIPTKYYQYLYSVTPADNHCAKFHSDGKNMIVYYEMLQFLMDTLKKKEEDASLQNDILCPVLTVLVKGVKDYPCIRKYIRSQVLPPLKDVHHRPEEGTTLRNYLCRYLTSPSNLIRYLTSELIFILCKKNVNRVIKYTGYGNAAGLFAHRGLLDGKRDKTGEAEYDSESEDSETEEYAEFKDSINPVVGCYEEPQPTPWADMSDEQKEYESMKLVELLDSLTKSGAIKPCKIGPDGKPQPVEHVLELQEGLNKFQLNNTDSD